MRSSKLLSCPGLPEGLTLESVSCICQVSTYLAHPAYTLRGAQRAVAMWSNLVGGGGAGGGGGGGWGGSGPGARAEGVRDEHAVDNIIVVPALDSGPDAAAYRRRF